jgi:uncharacterized membrane protein YebE (DUF533 family)
MGGPSPDRTRGSLRENQKRNQSAVPGIAELTRDTTTQRRIRAMNAANTTARHHQTDTLPAGPADAAVTAFVGSLSQTGEQALRLTEDAAARWLGYDADPDSRARMRQTGAVGAGALVSLGMLLGSHTGRAFLWNGAVLAAAAVLGKAAAEAGAALAGEVAGRLRRVSLLAAVISRASGGRTITPDEMRRIDERLDTLPEAVRTVLLARSEEDSLTPEDIDERFADPLVRREIYAISALIAAGGDEADQLRLSQLGDAFGLTPDEARALAEAARA